MSKTNRLEVSEDSRPRQNRLRSARRVDFLGHPVKFVAARCDGCGRHEDNCLCDTADLIKSL
jgi:DTW domain-containing protein YfiP